MLGGLALTLFGQMNSISLLLLFKKVTHQELKKKERKSTDTLISNNQRQIEMIVMAWPGHISP